jgi:hypothetical protein
MSTPAVPSSPHVPKILFFTLYGFVIVISLHVLFVLIFEIIFFPQSAACAWHGYLFFQAKVVCLLVIVAL